MLVVRVVAHRRQSWREIGPGKTAARLDPVAGSVVGVGQITQRRRAVLKGQARELRGRVVGRLDLVPVRQGDAGPPIGIVVGKGHRIRPLRDLGQPIRIVIE